MQATATSTSKLESVYRILEDRISTGVWPLDSVIPTEVQLASEFECSRSTIGKAVARLVHAGMVNRRTRVGTRVISSSVGQNRPFVELDAFAFIYPSERHEGIWRVVEAFQNAARVQNRRVVTLSTGVDYRKEVEAIARLSEFDVKGVAIYPIFQTARDQIHFAQVLMEAKFPMVLVELSIPGFGWPAVVIDGFDAGYTMTKYLISRGVRRIGFLSNYAWTPSMRDRYLGYRRALHESGIEEDLGAVMLEHSMHANFSDPLNEPTYLGLEYLDRRPKVDAVVCGDDFLAQGLLIAATRKGMKVPDDLKITGVSDYTISPLAETTLTTYRVPCEKIGQRTFELLHSQVSNNKHSSEETFIQGEIIIRKTA